MVLTRDQCTRIITMLEEGRSQRYTARRIGVSLSTVQRVLERYLETGQNLRRPGTGKTRCTTAREDRFIVTTMLRNRHLTAVEVKNQLLETRRDGISERTVRRRLKEANLTPHRPANGPKLERIHRTARRLYARDHRYWGDEEWARILFSDESRFMLYASDGRRRVYRRPGERFIPACFEEKVAFGGGSVMVWAGISSESRTELVLIENGSLTSARYVEEILNEHVGPYLVNMGGNSMFMHDNARPHTAQIVRDYFLEVGINCMNWPSRSPDLNPIEHVWDELGRRVRARDPAPATLRDLKQALVEEWDNIPQERIKNLINSMPNRLEAVRRARGGNTKY